MLSVSLPDTPWLNVIAWIYLATNATRVVTYLPQIIAVWRCTDGALSVSLLTWGSWVLSGATAVFYGVWVVHDLPFVLISLINFLGCTCVLVIAIQRRAQWRHRQSFLACVAQMHKEPNSENVPKENQSLETCVIHKQPQRLTLLGSYANKVAQSPLQISVTPVLACNASWVTPGASSMTFKPSGVTSITARSVMMRSTTPTPVRGSVH